VTAEVHVRRHGAVQVVQIDRPARRNAMTAAVAAVIAAAMEELDADPGLRVGVLTGAGGHFCAGMDLERFAAGEVSTIPGRGFAGLTEKPPRKPLIAAVEGYALAGGFETVLACDLVIASSTAVFGLPEVRRGLVARAGGLMRLPQRIPPARAMELLLTGRTFDVRQAEAWGLVNEVTPAGEALAGALRMAAAVAESAPLAVQVSKQVATESADWSLAERFARQSALTDPVFASSDAQEGARAFLEKRAPRWSGT
jgi:enoyl-CoA hydratase